MLYKVGAHLFTLLASLGLLLVAVLAGLACLTLVLGLAGPYLDDALPAASGTWVYTVLTAVPGFLVFRSAARRAEAEHPELRSPTLRLMRIAPVVGAIAFLLVILVQDARSPLQAAGMGEVMWTLMACVGALGSEVLLWARRTSSVQVEFT